VSVKAGDIVFDIRGDDRDLNRPWGGVEKSFGATSRVVGAAMAAVGAAMVSVFGKIAYESLVAAATVKQASLRIVSALGLPAEEAKRFAGIIKDVYGNNFGDSLGDVGAAVQEVALGLRDVGVTSDEEIRKATEAAFALRDAYGTDVGESVNAASGLMQNFGLTSAQAFDFITYGMQRGLNKSGDFLDSIGEYSTQFAEGGATAEQFFSIMETGIQSGMLGTDKAADAFKEFRVRLLDGSKSTFEAMKAIGLSVRKVTAAINDGSITTMDAFNLVQGAIAKTTNEATRMQAGVGLMGSQFEDLGAKTVLAMNSSATSMADMAGSTEILNQQYDTLGAKVETFRRKLIDMGMSIVESIEPQLKSLFDMITPVIEQFKVWVDGNQELAASMTWIGAAVGGVLLVGGLLLIAMPAISAIFATVAAVSWPMIAAIFAVGAALAALGYYVYQSMESWGGWQALWDWVMGLFSYAKDWFADNFGQLMSIFRNASDAILLVMGILWETLTIGFKLVWSVLSNVFGELGEGFASLSSTTENESGTILGTIERLSKLAVEYLKFMSKEVELFSVYMDKIWPLISAVMWVGTNLVLEPLFFLVDKLLWVFEQVSWIGNGIADALSWLFGTSGNFAGNVNISGPPALATGGVVNQSGWAMVGERGPELVQLPRGSTVYDAEQTKSAGSGGGVSVVLNATFNGVTNAQDMSRAIADTLGRELASRGLR